MSELSNLKIIKHKHELLLDKFLNDYNILQKSNKNLNIFIFKINDFLYEIQDFSKEIHQIHSYETLTKIAIKWNVIYSTILNTPFNIKINKPQFLQYDK